MPSSSHHPIDCHVGARIRAAREEAGLSQDVLATSLATTVREIQAIERGARVAAGDLFVIARTVGKSIDYFYEGLTPPER